MFGRNKKIEQEIDFGRLPRHIGVIMDGNGRWAKKRRLPRSAGHSMGAETLKKIVTECNRIGIGYITVYAFSTENFERDKEEVDELMNLLKKGIKKYGDYGVKKQVRLVVSGNLGMLSDELKREIEKQTRLTEKFEERVLNICVAYGGRQEICRAFGLLRADGIVNPTVKDVEERLYTKGLSPLDFVIRTGGEIRLSNFLLWQAAYAELYFTPVLWPDFSREEVKCALDVYATRVRRFGKN